MNAFHFFKLKSCLKKPRVSSWYCKTPQMARFSVKLLRLWWLWSAMMTLFTLRVIIMIFYSMMICFWWFFFYTLVSENRLYWSIEHVFFCFDEYSRKIHWIKTDFFLLKPERQSADNLDFHLILNSLSAYCFFYYFWCLRFNHCFVLPCWARLCSNNISDSQTRSRF